MASSSRRGPESNDQPVVHRILRAVAEREQCDPLELPPLFDVVNTEALATLANSPALCELSFSYYGYVVEIAGGHEVTVAVRPE